jgi:hypothetical protein
LTFKCPLSLLLLLNPVARQVGQANIYAEEVTSLDICTNKEEVCKDKKLLVPFPFLLGLQIFLHLPSNALMTYSMTSSKNQEIQVLS